MPSATDPRSSLKDAKLITAEGLTESTSHSNAGLAGTDDQNGVVSEGIANMSNLVHFVNDK